MSSINVLYVTFSDLYYKYRLVKVHLLRRDSESSCLIYFLIQSFACLLNNRNSKVGIGTGFLAEFKVPFLSTKCIVLATNNHVLPDANLALQSEIVFDTGQQGHTFSGKELFNTEIWRSSDARVCGSFI